MRVTDVSATADLVGRRVRISWTFQFDPEETLADLPQVRLRRKERDFQFPAPQLGQPDAFLVYDSADFPTPGTTASDLPIVEKREADQRLITTTTTLARAMGGVPVEVLRRTQTTRYNAGGRPLSRIVEILDLGDSIGGLIPNTTYYYELFGAGSAPRRSTAAPGDTHGLSRTLYEMLPSIHRRHDTVTRMPTHGAEAIPEASTRAGQLRRLFDLFGTPLDLMRSSAEGLRNLHDVDANEYRLLPLLAQWIGWDLSFDVTIPVQRHEVKYAPALYRLTGTIPSAHVWTQLETGWPVRVKEFTHNVFHSNRPEDLLVWMTVLDGGAWTATEEPLNLDTAFQGRPATAQTPDGTTWLFYHTHRMQRWGIWYKTHDEDGWTSALPLTTEPEAENNPTVAVMPDGSMWVFWSAYDEVRRRWLVKFCVRAADETWRAVTTFLDDATPRKDPCAFVDGDGRLWLFWMERVDLRWSLHYSRFEDPGWSPVVDFELAAGLNEPVEGQPFAIAHQTAGPAREIWVFWTRTIPTGDSGQTRSTLAFCTKDNLAPDDTGWGAVEALSTLPPTFHDSDPATFVNGDRNLELYWSSNRAIGWSIWRRTYSAGAWGAEERVTETPFTERHPMPLIVDEQVSVLYRSNRTPIYESPQEGGIRSEDYRYAGSTTLHTMNPPKIELLGRFGDFQGYTYDTRRGEQDRIAHDTVGLYVNPDTADAAKVSTGVGRIKQVRPDFLPVTRRAVFINESTLHAEYVYERPGTVSPRFITEGYQDELNSTLVSDELGATEDFFDELEE